MEETSTTRDATKAGKGGVNTLAASLLPLPSNPAMLPICQKVLRSHLSRELGNVDTEIQDTGRTREGWQ